MQCCDYPRLFTADGSAHRTIAVNSVYNDTEFVTAEFWHYETTTRTLKLPNGWIATYEAGVHSGGAMLVEVHDQFGNSITPTWEPGDIRPLRLSSVTQTVGDDSRTVTFTYDADSGWMPKTMVFDGKASTSIPTSTRCRSFQPKT